MSSKVAQLCFSHPVSVTVDVDAGGIYVVTIVKKLL